MAGLFKKLFRRQPETSLEHQPKSAEGPPRREVAKTPINEMIADIRAQSGRVAFKPSWVQEQENPDISRPGPMPVSNVRTSGGPVQATFQLSSTHLTAHLLDEGRTCRVALRTLGRIEVVGRELRLHLHLPIPLLTDAGIRPAHVLYGELDPAAAPRWSWLSSKHSRSLAECPYCFRAALSIEPRPDAPQPMRRGKPTAMASCQACERRFRYDYEQGAFEELSVEPTGELLAVPDSA